MPAQGGSLGTPPLVVYRCCEGPGEVEWELSLPSDRVPPSRTCAGGSLETWLHGADFETPSARPKKLTLQLFADFLTLWSMNAV